MRFPVPPRLPNDSSRVRFGVLGFACALSMITYLDRVCFGSVMPLLRAEFHLSDQDKGYLYAAFAFAYAAFEVPSGWMGDVFGPRRTLIRIVLWWSFFTALTGLIFPIPSWPRFAFHALFLVRFLFGIGEAGAFPNIARSIHNWFPFKERGFAQGTVWMAGRFAGGITPLVVSALFFKTVSSSGETVIAWRHCFWIFGVLGTLWCIAFWFWFRDRPEEKRSVNAAELALIHEGGDPPLAGHEAIPWRRLLTSSNLWALCLMYFCAAYGWYFNITWLPEFLNGFGVNEETWGLWPYSLMAGMPLLVGSVACLTGGLATDFLIKKTGNKKWGRRMCGIIGHSLCALCYFGALFARDSVTFVAAISLAAFCNDLTMGATWAICLDIGKRYSGIVSGCMNSIGNLGSTAAGILTGKILHHFGSDTSKLAGVPHQFAPSRGWQINFFLFAAVYIVATLLWLRIDSTELIIPEET